MLPALGLAASAASPADGLTDDGLKFDDVWTIYRDDEAGRAIIRAALLRLPATQALLEGLRGRGPVSVSGALHLLARLGHARPDGMVRFRGFVSTLTEFGIVAYSNKLQTVRALVGVAEGDDHNDVSVRIVHPDRPYSNVRNLREVLRRCRDHIWWGDPHFARKGLEPLADEADATRVKEILILSGPAQTGDAVKDFKRFRAEMQNLGISVEWRVVQTPDRKWHDRFIITRAEAWNVPPLNTIYKGDYSEFKKTSPPPFKTWWAAATPLA